MSTKSLDEIYSAVWDLASELDREIRSAHEAEQLSLHSFLIELRDKVEKVLLKLEGGMS